MSETPESNPGTLVVSSPKALAIANRQLRIAGQALARIGQERYIEFFATRPEASRAFVQAVSRYYPCSEALIDRYSEKWEWGRISKSTAIAWTEELVERYAHRWDWGDFGLSQSEVLPWSEALIQRYADRWDWNGHWGGLSKNQALPWSETLIERFKDRWRWGVFGLSWSQALPWSEPLIARYTDQWDWEWLSWNQSLPWTEALIDCYADQWHWSKLSRNEALPWSDALLLRYADRWNWENLSRNQALPWSEAFLLRYADRWEWGWLSRNEALPWSEGFLDRHAERWDWWALSLNEALPWSEALIEHYAHRWSWLLLSQNQTLPWTESLIERYEDRWIWFSHNPDDSDLSGNPALPWSIALIERYEERWHWGEGGLSTNKSLPWSNTLIERFHARWNWELLSWNEAIPWSEALIEIYADRWGFGWEKISEIALSKILPVWSESSICAVMDRMLHGPESGGDSIHACCAADAVDHAKDEQHHERPAQPAAFDPELFEAGIYLAGWHIEKGARTFAAYAKAMTEDLGDAFRPYLKSCYVAIKMDPRATDDMKRDMDSMGSVEDANLDAVLAPDAQQSAPDAATHTEQPQPTPAAARGDPDQSPTDTPGQGGKHRDHRGATPRQPEGTRDDSLVAENPPADGRALGEGGDTGSVRASDRDLAFDEKTYAKAKPHFQAMLKDAQAAGRDLSDFIRTVLAHFGSGIKPYVIRFAKELEGHQDAEQVQLETPDESPASMLADDSEWVQGGIEMAVFYIERGELRFVNVAHRLAEDLGVSLGQIKPFLQQWYNGAREFLKNHGYDASDIDDAATVKIGMETLFAKQASGKQRIPDGIGMSYKPDYGLRLMQDGISRDTDHNFYDLRLYSLTVLGSGQYSTMVELPFAGELHALSLDFNQRQLDQILSHAPPEIASFIPNEIAGDPSTPRTIDFAGEVVFGVRARLGEIQRVERETFVPFIAQEII